MEETNANPTPQYRRRPRYAGKYPRRFEDKYKEHTPDKHPDTVAKVLASGKTPAGTHRPIMVSEVLEILEPKPGEIAVDCTLGFGGHALQLLPSLLPGGRLIGLDADPLEFAKTEARMRASGFGPDCFQAFRTNFAAIQRILTNQQLCGVDIILADLGVSSMQLDNPARGFSMKFSGPLDLRMNPSRGQPASEHLKRWTASELEGVLRANADEPYADLLATKLAGRLFASTDNLSEAIRGILKHLGQEERERSIRRCFQAVRIAVNDEFEALDSLLRQLPACLHSGGRVAILTFHSGEDRRVKKALEAGYRSGDYREISSQIRRPTETEQKENPRSIPAKLRWARRA